MNAITIRNLSDDVSRALEARAARNGTTAETEAERILQDALQAEQAMPPKTARRDEPAIGLGTALRQFGEEYPEFGDLDFSRDQTQARGVSFE